MKSVINLTIVSLFAMFVSSCNSSEKLLCRSWRLVDAEFDEASVNVSKEQKPLMIKQLKDSCLFTFNKDHSYITKLPQRIEKGTWSFNKKCDTLFTQNDHTGSSSKINVLSTVALDMDIHSKDGVNLKFVLAPVQK